MNQSTVRSHRNNHLFWISFFPALLYWYLDQYYPVRVAVSAGLVLAMAEIGLELLISRRIHKISRLNFVLLVVMGALSLFDENGIWFKLVPGLTGLILGGGLLWTAWAQKDLLYGLMVEMNPQRMAELAPGPIWQQLLRAMELDLALFFFLYGIWMGGVAIWGSSGQWIFFKTAGFYLIFGVLMLCEALLFRRRLRRIINSSNIRN